MAWLYHLCVAPAVSATSNYLSLLAGTEVEDEPSLAVPPISRSNVGAEKRVPARPECFPSAMTTVDPNWNWVCEQ